MDLTVLSGMAGHKRRKCNIIVCLKIMEMEETIYISSLKPNESMQVDMAWIVNENDLDHMYLNINGDGAAYEFSDAALKMGLVDLTQQP